MNQQFSVLFGEFIDPVNGTIEAVTAKLGDSINDRLGLSREILDQLSQVIERTVAASIRKASRASETLLARSLREAFEAVESANSTTSDIANRALADSQNILDEARQLIADQERSILEQIAGGLDATIETITGIETNIEGFIEERVQPAIDRATRALERVASIGEAFTLGVDKLVADLGLPFLGKLDILKDVLELGISSIGTRMFENLAPDLIQRIDPLLKLMEEDEDVPDEIKALTAPGLLPLAAVGGVLAAVAIPMIISNLVSGAVQPFMEKLRQRVMAKAQPTLIPPADLLRGEFRGIVDAERVLLHGHRQGFTTEDIDVIRELVKVRPGTLDLIDYWRRELIDEAALDTELRLLGWTSDWVKVLKEAAFPPPGVQDLITMAVREVFTPEIAERFGQFEDLPQEFVDNARRVGLSELWAGRFWAAHWRLPSVQQGFEALHRTTETSLDPDKDTITLPSGKTIETVIGTSTLDLLLKSSDVMPFWRPLIREIAFRPFTRVDVRRMHKVGVLSEDDVMRSYLDLGYDSTKARQLTAFTLALNAPQEDAVAVRERDLTKSDIIGLLNDGLLDADGTRSALVEMGFDNDESDLLVQRELTQEAARERRADIALVLDQAKSREITFDMAMEEFGKLNLTQRELTKAGVDLNRSFQVRTRKPALGPLVDWLNLGLTSIKDHIEELRGLSFSDRHIFNMLIQLGLDFDAKRRRELRDALRGMNLAEEDIERGFEIIRQKLGQDEELTDEELEDDDES